MLKLFYSNLNVRRFRYIVLFLSFILLAIAIVLYLKNRYTFENILFNETQQRQLTIAKSGALSINLFLANTQEDITYLGHLPAIESLDIPAAKNVIADYLKNYSLSAVATIGLLDKNGKALIIYDRNGMAPQVGQNFSDRGYYKWSKIPANKGKTYITQPFLSRAGSTTGTNIIVVSYPVYYNGQYNGDLVFVISLQKFS
jgi:hypothetical protein